MHFWIDKRSQGCGFSGRHLVPPSFSGYGRNHRFLCAGFHPKPMVTPVHRFQSIESVANNSLRHSRSPAGYNQSRLPISNNPPTVHYNGSTSNIRNLPMGRSNEIINTSPPTTTTTTTTGPTVNITQESSPTTCCSPTAKIKCGVWLFFAIVIFFSVAAKYYFHGVNVGLEAVAFCFLLVIMLIVIGLLSLYEAMSPASANGQRIDILNPLHTGPDDLDESQVPNHLLPPNNNTTAELPPPPYHIAIMLPSQNEPPPPSYEKAVT